MVGRTRGVEAEDVGARADQRRRVLDLADERSDDLVVERARKLAAGTKSGTRASYDPFVRE